MSLKEQGGFDMLFVAHMKSPREQPTVSRSAGPVWTNITVNATGQASVSGNALLPKTPETFAFDADGNLVQDGLWTYTWDAENRLVSMQSVSSVPSAAKRKLDFAYDRQGRRTQKVVSTWNGSAYVPQSTNRFVYDGWNLAVTLASDLSPLASFTWGLDLSGSLHGAGGVGGLLWMSIPSGTNAGMYFYAYDGNGNVMALVNAGDGSVAARYEYGPFGELLRATGPMAKANPIRWSTKYQDDEMDLIMYPYRPYSAPNGRFLCKDPIGEWGGLNLYGFVGNDPVRLVDPLGLEVLCYYDDHGVWTCRSPLESCKKCKCKQAKFGTPDANVSSIFNRGLPPFPGSPAPSSLLLGITVPYTISVEGDPKKCKCKYVDSGSIKGSVTPQGAPAMSASQDFNNKETPISCESGADHPGFLLGVGNNGSLSYSLTYSWTGTVTCQDDSGSISDTASISRSFSGNASWP
jgi:RHS repeat-associated protein